MGLLDIGIGLAEKYGPAALSALGNLNRGMATGSPMSAGFAAPSRGTSSGSFGFAPRKKKRHGLSASDIRGAQKVARLVHAFGFKPKVSKRKHRR